LQFYLLAGRIYMYKKMDSEMITNLKDDLKATPTTNIEHQNEKRMLKLQFFEALENFMKINYEYSTNLTSDIDEIGKQFVIPFTK
jgi:hypothetical protein